MDLGVLLPTMSPRGEERPSVVASARHAERLGYESVWVVDQLVAGTGVPFTESVVALAAAAGGTTRVRLGLGVLVLPLRPVAWVAKQVAALQEVSAGRLLLGVGVGGDRHDRSWAAVGVPAHERGVRTDAALAVLPDLVAGRPTALGDGSDAPTVQLAPAAAMPPLLVGGMSDAALRRAARADGWYLLPGPLESVAVARDRLTAAVDAAGPARARPGLTVTVMVAIDGDPALPAPEGVRQRLTDPDGMYGVPAEAVPDLLVTGPPTVLAEHLRGLRELGVDRVVVSVAAGDWCAQAQLVAEAFAGS